MLHAVENIHRKPASSRLTHRVEDLRLRVHEFGVNGARGGRVPVPGCVLRLLLYFRKAVTLLGDHQALLPLPPWGVLQRQILSGFQWQRGPDMPHHRHASPFFVSAWHVGQKAGNCPDSKIRWRVIPIHSLQKKCLHSVEIPQNIESQKQISHSKKITIHS